MKKYLATFWIALAVSAFAEKMTLPTAFSAGLKNVKKTENTRVFTNIITEIDVDKLTVRNQNFTTLHLDGYVYHGEVGHPKLPAKTQLLDVPMGAKVEIRILSSRYVDWNLSEKGFENQLFPVQPPIRKSAEEKTKLTQNKSAYHQKTFNSRDIVDVEHLGIAKNRQLAQLNICPIQYLPSENLIRVHYFIEFEVVFVGETSPSNRNASAKNTPKPIVYQIISDRKFEKTLAPFIAWKTEKGFDVRVAYTSQLAVGNTTASIRNYLKNQYDADTAADYLLLVGDIAEIPAFPTSFPNGHQLLEPETHITDLYYAEYTDDGLPDIYYGRMSASTAQQLRNQIEKIIAMEKLEIPEPDFLKKSLLIAGNEAQVSNRAFLNAQVNYGAKYYFNRANGVDSTTLFSPNSAAQSPAVKAFINNGGGFVNYTAHGAWDRWVEPLLTVSDIAALTNTNRYPFVIGNCCLSGKFEHGECFAEALLRAAQKGAVTYIGASNTTYFGEDFIWAIGSVSNSSTPSSITYENSGLGVYDRIFHTHGENLSDWSRTAGEMAFWGNTAVQTANATHNDDMKRYYWEVYHVFGDPSYTPYFIEPKELSVSHPANLIVKETELSIQAVPYAYVGFSMDGELLAGGQADSAGQITFTFEEDLPPGDAKLVVTAQNYAPYIALISITLTSDLTTPVIPDHTAFEVMMDNGTLQACVNAETPGKASIRLMNMLGQTVATVVSNGAVNVGRNDFYFDLSNLPKGIYICTYSDGNQMFSQKIVW